MTSEYFWLFLHVLSTSRSPQKKTLLFVHLCGVFARQSGPCTCVAWRPDGNALMVGLEDGSWQFRSRGAAKGKKKPVAVTRTNFRSRIIQSHDIHWYPILKNWLWILQSLVLDLIWARFLWCHVIAGLLCRACPIPFLDQSCEVLNRLKLMKPYRTIRYHKYCGWCFLPRFQWWFDRSNSQT